LTNDVFKQILQNIEDFSMQYGHMGRHQNEEARSRFLSAIRLSSSFGRSADINTIVLFSGVLFNTPETLLEGRVTMEYQFKTFGGITVIFIEVKLDIGSATERQNCIAQVIAECDGTSGVLG
ncbi:hypothetical protein V8E54_012965, partial [Elaphomyces granulatus]